MTNYLKELHQVWSRYPVVKLTLGVEICNALPDPDVNRRVFHTADTDASLVGCVLFSRVASNGLSFQRLWCRDDTGEAFGELWRPVRIFRPLMAVVAVLVADILGRLRARRYLKWNEGYTCTFWNQITLLQNTDPQIPNTNLGIN